jgi:hypothetical protein
VAATDEGSGISAFALEVDGTELQRWAVATTRKPYAAPFYDPTPCSPEAVGAYGFDTATLADGRHNVRIKVIDPSGNETRSDPVEVMTDNRADRCSRAVSVRVPLPAQLRAVHVPLQGARAAAGELSICGRVVAHGRSQGRALTAVNGAAVAPST